MKIFRGHFIIIIALSSLSMINEKGDDKYTNSQGCKTVEGSRFKHSASVDC